MEKRKGFRGEIGVHTNKYYGATSVYEYFNYGVDLIMEQFKPCEKALDRVKDAERIWAEKEQALEKKYDEKRACVQEKLESLEEEAAGNDNIAALQRKRNGLRDEVHNVESRIEYLFNEKPGVQEGQLTLEKEEELRQSYNNLLQKYKAEEAGAWQDSSSLQPLQPILAQEKELISQRASCEESIVSGKQELDQNASRKALEEIRTVCTEEERKNPLAAISQARERIAHPEGQEQAAREYAHANHQIKAGRVSLTALKAIGRGIFCVPMILVRSFVMKKSVYRFFVKRIKIAEILPTGGGLDEQKTKILHWILDGISLLLNLILIIMTMSNPASILGTFWKGVPSVMAVGLLAGMGLGFWRKKKTLAAVLGAVKGALGCFLVDYLLYLYPLFIFLMLKSGWIFWLWLVASIVLYAAEDVYQLINRKNIETAYAKLLEVGRKAYADRQDHSRKLLEAYETALPQALEAEKERIRGLERDLEDKGLKLQAVRQRMSETENAIWEKHKADAIAEGEAAWLRSRQELADLLERKQEMDEDIQEIDEDLAEADRRFAERSTALKQELGSLEREKEQERKDSRHSWEEESRQAKENYESLLSSLVGQLRQDGFQNLTRNEDKGINGFDYRKAWSRMYYLSTSVVGMTPYYYWFQKERKTGHEVLKEMVSDAAWVPSEYANVVPSRLITGIERCPMSSEIQEAVKAVLIDWQTHMCQVDKDTDDFRASIAAIASSGDKKDYTMNSNLPKDGFYKLRLNEVDKSWEEGDQYPTIFVYDFGNLDVNHEKRQALGNVALRTLCAPTLQCWQLDTSRFHIDLMLTDHKGDFENSNAWKLYGEAGKIYQGADIENGLETIYQAARRTRNLVGNQSYFAKVQSMAWEDEPFSEGIRIMIVSNMDYEKISSMNGEINNVLDITKKDENRSRSGIWPYFFMDLNRLQEGDKAAAQVCLDIVKNFKGNIYKLTEKQKPEDYEEGFYDWKVVEREKLQKVLTDLAS